MRQKHGGWRRATLRCGALTLTQPREARYNKMRLSRTGSWKITTPSRDVCKRAWQMMLSEPSAKSQHIPSRYSTVKMSSLMLIQAGGGFFTPRSMF